MAEGYTKRVRTLLTAHGCHFARNGKGDHEIWRCPNAARPIVVDGKIMSKVTANAILKQAGIDERI